jgi:hypothetical protein
MTYARHDLVKHAGATNLAGHVDGCPKCEEIIAGSKLDVVDELMAKLAPRQHDPMAFGPIKVDLEVMRELLVRAACPVVCAGELDGGENWHQVCLRKADDAMHALYPEALA